MNDKTNRALSKEEKKQEKIRAARAARRAKQAAEQQNVSAQPTPSAQKPAKAPAEKPPAKKKKHKRKINKFRVAVISLGLLLIVLVIFGIRNAIGVRAPISDTVADGDPEFFATIKPETSAAPTASPVPVSAFEGALFIGDSMTTQLKDYVTDGAGSSTELHDANFITRSDYSWAEAQNELNGSEGALPLDDSTSLTLTETIDHFSAKKLYILLGKEDLPYNDVSTVTATAQDVLSALQTKYPDLEITVQAITPMLEWIDYEGLSSSTIAEYNAAMQSYCTGKKNLKFLNIAAFCTEGYLPAEYCADPGGMCIHLNDAGCAIWTDYLTGAKTPEAPPTPSPTPEPTSDDTGDTTDTGDSTDSGDYSDDTYTDDTYTDDTYTDDTYTDDTGDYSEDTGDYTEDTGDSGDYTENTNDSGDYTENTDGTTYE